MVQSKKVEPTFRKGQIVLVEDRVAVFLNHKTPTQAAVLYLEAPEVVLEGQHVASRNVVAVRFQLPRAVVAVDTIKEV